MIDRQFVQRAWDCLSDVLAEEGFALGGGLAMRAHSIIDRETQDIDAFRRDPVLSDPDAFDRVEPKIKERLETEGLRITKVKNKDFERAYEVLDPNSGDSTRVDLGRDRFPNTFVRIPGYGTVVNRDDMAGMKMRALYERHAERDYVDYDAMRRSGIWSAEDLVDLLERTGSITRPEDGNWSLRLSTIPRTAADKTDEMLLEDLGVDDVGALFRRLSDYSLDHDRVATNDQHHHEPSNSNRI